MQRMTSSQDRATTAAAAAQPRHVVRMRGAERSTDSEAFGTYAESIALMAAVVCVLAAAWTVMLPGADATLDVPAAPVPALAEFTLTPGGHALQPNVDRAAATAVQVDAAAGTTDQLAFSGA